MWGVVEFKANKRDWVSCKRDAAVKVAEMKERRKHESLRDWVRFVDMF